MSVADPSPATDHTAPGPDRHRARPPLVDLSLRLEEDERLDQAVDALRPLGDALVADPGRRDLLLGRQLGHSLHPLLTDLPIGAWTSALVLDLLGGRDARPAARLLVGTGIVAAVPTALTGLADWSHTSRRDSRVGVVHGALNSVALALFGASWLARGRGRHGRGVALGMVGAAAATVSGYLGAHLSLARNVSARDESFAGSLPADGGTDELTS